jgi:hypothetical protein
MSAFLEGELFAPKTKVTLVQCDEEGEKAGSDYIVQSVDRATGHRVEVHPYSWTEGECKCDAQIKLLTDLVKSLLKTIEEQKEEHTNQLEDSVVNLLRLPSMP